MQFYFSDINGEYTAQSSTGMHLCMYVNGITPQSLNKRDGLQVAKMAKYAVMTNTFCLCGTAIRTIIEVATLQYSSCWHSMYYADCCLACCAVTSIPQHHILSVVISSVALHRH